MTIRLAMHTTERAVESSYELWLRFLKLIFSWICLGSLCVGCTWSVWELTTILNSQGSVFHIDRCFRFVMWALGIPHFLYLSAGLLDRLFTCSRIPEDVGWGAEREISQDWIDWLGGMINKLLCMFPGVRACYGMLNSELCFIKFVVIKGGYLRKFFCRIGLVWYWFLLWYCMSFYVSFIDWNTWRLTDFLCFKQ